MKFNFKKISAIATSVLMTGMTVGTAMAAGIKPADLGGQGNFAIVYGSTADSMDQAQATAIDTALRNQFLTATGDRSVLAGSDKATEDDIALNEATWTSVGDISSPITYKKVKGLLNEDLSFDDGNGDKDYEIQEKIVLNGDGNMAMKTTLDDDELKGVALTFEENDFSYHLCIEKTFNASTVGDGDDDKESIILPILGKEYEIIGMENTGTHSISVVTSSDATLNVGSKTVVAGKEIVFKTAFDGSAEILIDGTSKNIKEGSEAKVNGIRVKVVSIGYNSNDPSQSVAFLKVGEDKLKNTYEDGDAFIGEDEDKPIWVWDIVVGDKDSTETCIGVRYDRPYDLDKEEGLAYVGEGLVLPNNYAGITLDSLLEVEYQKAKFYFDDLYLYNTTYDRGATKEDVLIVELEDEEAIEITDGASKYETSKIAYNSTGSLYAFLDEDYDYSSSGEFRAIANATAAVKIIVGETELVPTNTAGTELALVNSVKSNAHVMTLNISAATTHFGTNKEDADANDVLFGSASDDMSTADVEIMDHYGFILAEGSDVESQLEKDSITLSIPEEEVLATLSVSLSPATSGATENTVGNMIFRDTESSSYAGKNVVIVGGSCVNSAAATVLGVASDRGVPGCYADSGLSTGQFLIKKGFLGGKTAIVVAGYEADDTVKAAQFLINKGALEGKYSSTTSEIIA